MGEEKECWICGRTEKELEYKDFEPRVGASLFEQDWIKSITYKNVQICPVCVSLLEAYQVDSSNFIKDMAEDKIRSFDLELKVKDKED